MKSTRKRMSSFPNHQSTLRIPENLAIAGLPGVPFNWHKAPSFYLRENSAISVDARDRSDPPPAPAFAWHQSISREIVKASSSIEAVPLIDLTREVCQTLLIRTMSSPVWPL